MKHKKGEACAVTSGAARANMYNNSLSPVAYKPEHCSILHKKIIKALEKNAMKRNAIIPYPEVNRVMSFYFHCDKDDKWILICELEKLGLIETIPFHGIRILRR